MGAGTACREDYRTNRARQMTCFELADRWQQLEVSDMRTVSMKVKETSPHLNHTASSMQLLASTLLAALFRSQQSVQEQLLLVIISAGK